MAARHNILLKNMERIEFFFRACTFLHVRVRVTHGFLKTKLCYDYAESSPLGSWNVHLVESDRESVDGGYSSPASTSETAFFFFFTGQSPVHHSWFQ